LQFGLGKSYLDLWASAVRRMAGEAAPPVAAPDPRDKRFADPEWSSNQFFDFLKQAYLVTVKWANHLVKDAQGLDPHIQQKAEFYIRQIVNAIAPSNFVLTTPSLARDARLQRRQPCARHAHAGGGHPGRRGDLKIPPDRHLDVRGRPQPRGHAGKVIFQNDLIQLINTHQRPKIAAVPVLIMPP
jgi:polyhydroxyalkanoate synthase